MGTKFSNTHIEGVCVIHGKRFHDCRGFFQELYNVTEFPAHIRFGELRQVSLSVSKRDALRGLHASPYDKLVSVVGGAVYDVVVDLRKHSPTCGKWIAHVLSLENKKSIFIPSGCAHGFLALESTTMLYLQGDTFEPTLEQDLTVFDKTFNIFWPRTAGETDYIMSSKDLLAPTLRQRRPEICREITLKRNLIIGATGQVGGALIENLGANTCFGTFSSSPAHHMVQYSLNEAVQDPNLTAALLTATRPDVVYICAAYTWVDGCENEHINCRLINTTAPTLIAKMAASMGSKVVFFSTDYVFDGTGGPYVETAAICPVNVYGESKAAAEEAILGASEDALVIRTTIVYGPDEHGKNFAYQVLSKLYANDPVSCLTDQFSTPTYNRDLAEMTVNLVEANCTGVYNCVGPETMSRYEFARQLAEALDLNQSLLRKATTAELESQALSEGRTLAKRGSKLGLNIDKAAVALGRFKPRTVKESLEHWYENERGKSLFLKKR